MPSAEIIEVSPRAARLFNYLPAELAGEKFEVLLAPKKNSKYLRRLEEKIEQQEGYSGFLICRNSLGIMFKVGWLFVSQTDSAGGKLRGKILEIIRSNHRWSFDHYFEHYDFLTGLPARELVFKYITDCMINYDSFREEFSLITLDIDDFSQLNEEEGVEVGDEVLKRTGLRLLELSNTAGMVGRVGSDEFTVVSSRLTGEKKLATFLRNLLWKVAEPIKLDDRVVNITCSAGVVETVAETTQPGKLLEQTFFALDRVRDAGGDSYRYFFSTDNLQAK